MMKKIIFIFILMLLAAIMPTTSFAQTSDSTTSSDKMNWRSVKVWGYGGITKLIWSAKYFGGMKTQLNKHIFGFEYFQYGEVEEGGIIWDEKIPNQVVEATTVHLNYGYCLSGKLQRCKFIPSLGVGVTNGVWRTDQYTITSGGGGFFTMGMGGWATKDYITKNFKGVSLVPQFALLFHTSWGGLGFVMGTNVTFADQTYFTYNGSFMLCLGKMR